MSFSENKIDFLKELKDNNSAEFEKEIEKIKRDLFNKYCFKKTYKDKCEAAYCVDACIDKCQYLHEIRKLNKKLNI